MSGRSSRSGRDEQAAPRGAWWRRAGRVLLAVLGVLAVAAGAGWCRAYAYVGGYDAEMARAPRTADAAVVLGAAVWPGGVPSPVLLERTRAAGRLYRAGRVRWIATTGGLGQHAPAEGVAARDVLVREGWVEDASRVIVEERSHTTYENLAYVASALRARGVRRVFVVSHGFHVPRGVAMARGAGFEAWGVAVEGSVRASLARHPGRQRAEAWLIAGYWLSRVFAR